MLEEEEGSITSSILSCLTHRRALRTQLELHGDPQTIIKTDIFILLVHGLSHTTRVDRPVLSTHM